MIAGFQLMVAKGHPFTQDIITRFPDYEEETDEGYKYPISYERKDELRTCLENIDTPKGQHPAQKAYLEFKRAEAFADLCYQDSWSDNSCGLYREKDAAYAAEDEALKKLKEAEKLVFVRDKDYAWILVEK